MNVVDFLVAMYPFAYFMVCFITTFARRRSLLLRAVGIATHTVMALVVITIAVKVGMFAMLFAAVGVFFGYAWVIMYALLPNDPAA